MLIITKTSHQLKSWKILRRRSFVPPTISKLFLVLFCAFLDCTLYLMISIKRLTTLSKLEMVDRKTDIPTRWYLRKRVFLFQEIMGIDDTSNFKEWPHVACRTMTVLSTISNPVLYLVFSEAFRDALCKKLSSGVGRSQTNTGTNKIGPMSVCEVKDYLSQHTENTEIFTIHLRGYKKGIEGRKQMTLENVSSC